MKSSNWVIPTIVVAVILVLFLILLHQRDSADNAEEKFIIKHRAYHSCSKPDDCKQKITSLTNDSLTTMNPFVWPYSGSMTPQDVIPKKTMIQSETDHEQLSH